MVPKKKLKKYALRARDQCPLAKGPSRKRQSEGVDTNGEGGSKKARAALSCSLKKCAHSLGEISPHQHCHVEIKAAQPATNLTTFLKGAAVNWSAAGEAMFHGDCWNRLLKDTRRRNPKNTTIHMSSAEQRLLREAAKTMEKHDSIAAVQSASSRIAELMRRAKHCVVFTGAGISTSAGIGDYRGKGGKWTEMDREAVTEEMQSLIGGGGQPGGGPGNEETGDIGVPYEDLRPTYTHEALVKLIEMGIVHYIISQNGDGLHGLSGCLVCLVRRWLSSMATRSWSCVRSAGIVTTVPTTSWTTWLASIAMN